jgi:outer membrane protein OmpA-like peptidoglycan-associated protein
MKVLQLLKITSLAFLITLGSCAGSQSLSGTKNSKAYALMGQALQDYDIGDYDNALSKVEKAIKKDPRYIQAHDLKARIKQDQGKTEEAIVSYKKILELDPRSKYAHFDLAKIYFNRMDYASSTQHLNALKGVSVRDNPLYGQIQRLRRNTEFASEAVKNPVPFKPVNLGDKVNSKFEDYFPGLTLDEERLFFTRRDASVSLRMQNEDLYIAQKENNSWSMAKAIGAPVNTSENEGAFTTTVDGKYVLFTACNRRNGRGSCDIWFTRQSGEKWQEPRNMGGPINSPAWESQPSMASDGTTLYFVSNRRGGYGGTDLWKTVLEDKGWSVPVNLGPKINTSKDEQFPFIHPDGTTLYFTSEGHPGMGQSDIYFCKLEGSEWGEVVNIGYPINTPGEEWNFVVNRTGTKAYFSSNGIENSFGGMDIYTFDLYEAARPNKVSYVKGSVIDAKSKLPLGSSVELIDLKTGKVVVQTNSDSKNGRFLTALASNGNYALHVRKDGYLFHSENFELRTSSLEKPYELDVALNKIEVGKAIALRNVFFDTDKAVILPESKAELKTLVDFIKENPTIKIRIKGHTDDVGNDAHNLDLSKRRAKAVYQHIVEQNVDPDRLSWEGYGETKPIESNATEEGRARNRRTEFEIVN